MHKDFHYYVMYVLAQKAGFSVDDSHTIAYSSQYVDDATNSGPILFNNKAIYYHIGSAHGMVDLQNGSEYLNHLAWIPFHFLPGNCGNPAGAGEDKSFVERIVCCPNSYISREMVLAALSCPKESPHALHRLGITMHVYADTWAHKGFAGIVDADINGVSEINYHADGLLKKAEEFAEEQFAEGIEKLLPLGHGAAYKYPDWPFLDKWEYLSSFAGKQERTNTDDFVEAAHCIYKALSLYKQGAQGTIDDLWKDSSISGLSDEEQKQIRDYFMRFDSKNEDVRCQQWGEAINRGAISGVKPVIPYNSRGVESWKSKALGRDDLLSIEELTHKYGYTEEFLNSDWKKFHDAIHDHHYFVLRTLLPRYGLIVA